MQSLALAESQVIYPPTLTTSIAEGIASTPADVTPPDSTLGGLLLDAVFDPPEVLSPLDWGLEFLDLVPELRTVVAP